MLKVPGAPMSTPGTFFNINLCLVANVPEECQVASIFADTTLYSPLISKHFAIMKHNFKCLYHIL